MARCSYKKKKKGSHFHIKTHFEKIILEANKHIYESPEENQFKTVENF
jgi:glutaredoxin